MRKFIVFKYSDYYPSGGLEDCSGIFDTLPEAIHNAVEEYTSDDYDILEVPALVVHRADGSSKPLTPARP